MPELLQFADIEIDRTSGSVACQIRLNITAVHVDLLKIGHRERDKATQHTLVAISFEFAFYKIHAQNPNVRHL